MIGYRGVRNTDGTLTVRDVPIFVECVRGENAFTKEWLAGALADAKQRASEGYHPPLHVRHHSAGDDDVRAAGFFEITKLGQITFKGSPRAALFADLTVTDPGVEWDLLAKRLPYRSVEIFNVSEPSIGSLALLDHEAPYLELPMLVLSNAEHVGQREFASATIANPFNRGGLAEAAEVVACFSRRESATFLFQDSETMTTQQNFEDDAADDGEDMEAEGGMSVDSIVAAIESGEISLADFEAIKAAMAAKVGGEAEEPEAEEPVAAPTPSPAGEAMQNSTDRTEFARLQGEIDALKANAAAKVEADKARDDVEAALTKLEGRPLGANLKQRLTDYRTKHGSAAFAAYVDSMAQTFAAGALHGASDRDAAARFADQTRNVSAAAAKFQAISPEAATAANQFSAEWRQLKAHNRTRHSEARYVEIQMARQGFHVAAE